jgi:fused signal recognition particle receptor
MIASPFKQLEADLAGPGAPQLVPARPWLKRRRRFRVDPCPRHKPLRQPLEKRRQRILPEGRIEENHVELRPPRVEKRESIPAHDLDLCGSEQRPLALKLGRHAPVRLHHYDASGSARGRLEAERSAPGEEIEAGETVQALAEPVEHGLAHAIGRGPQPGTSRHTEAAPPVRAGDNPDAPFVRMHGFMVAVASWAARLKAGLARTREVLNTPVTELFARQRIDESLYDDLEAALLQSDCGVEATRSIIGSLREKVRKERIEDTAELKRALKDALLELLAPLERGLDASGARPFVIMVAGVNGSGKTTSIGKLAKWLQLQRKTVLLAAGDTFRAAAREQLIVWGERNAVPVIAQESGDPGAVVFDALGAARARGVDVVIADTAGRLPTQLHLMEEIRKVKRVAGKAQPGAPHEMLLVLDANTGQNALAQVKAFDEALGLTGLVLTKLDGTAKGGVVCAIAKQRPIPLLFVGVGEGIDDLRPFVARDFVEALVD